MSYNCSIKSFAKKAKLKHKMCINFTLIGLTVSFIVLINQNDKMSQNFLMDSTIFLSLVISFASIIDISITIYYFHHLFIRIHWLCKPDLIYSRQQALKNLLCSLKSVGRWQYKTSLCPGLLLSFFLFYVRFEWILFKKKGIN